MPILLKEKTLATDDIVICIDHPWDTSVKGYCSSMVICRLSLRIRFPVCNADLVRTFKA